MYDSTDPRSSLPGAAPTAVAAPPGTGIANAEYRDFTESTPDEVSAAGTRTWITRGQNAVLSHIRPVPGDPLEPTELTSEQVVILPHEDSAAEFRGREPRTVRGPGLVMVPPGPSQIVPTDRGDLVRLVDTGSLSWAARARNADSYTDPHPRVAPLEYWPEPVGGDELRVYLLADVPADPARFGRIFRSRAFMVNFLAAHEGPRDRTRLSPHHHDDFEQYSLAVSGEFVHHIRTPWGTDADAWRDDEHRRVGSPSLTIIPPPTVHTSEACGPGTNQLIDIFSPPRADFSAKPGWVLNAEEYPRP